MNPTISSFARRASALAAVALTLFVSGVSYQVAAQGRELSLADILIALRSKKAVIEEKNKILVDAVKERGITFALTPEIEKELGSTGARVELIAAIRDRATKPKTESGEQVKTEIQPPVVKSPPPPDFAFYRSRATQELTANNLDAAMADLDKALELRPGDAGSYVDKGTIFTRKENYEAAIEQYSKAIELNPNYALAFYNRGTVKEKLGKTQDALDDYQRSADLDPTNELAKSTVARVKLAIAEAEADANAKAAAKAAEEARLAEAARRPQMVNAGSLNAYAIKLVMPIYTANEKRMGIQGKVTVSIKLDEEGKVVSAKAVDGPKPLWNAAETAIKQTKFKPVLFAGKPIAATGFITFNFTLN
ncbi:MAG: TonB family protein [Pyrinomonadaceae bacterium]